MYFAVFEITVHLTVYTSVYFAVFWRTYIIGRNDSYFKKQKSIRTYTLLFSEGSIYLAETTAISKNREVYEHIRCCFLKDLYTWMKRHLEEADRPRTICATVFLLCNRAYILYGFLIYRGSVGLPPLFASFYRNFLVILPYVVGGLFFHPLSRR